MVARISASRRASSPLDSPGRGDASRPANSDGASQPQIGVVLPTREVVLGDVSFDDVLRIACRAEELGFGSVWAGESPLDRHRPDPFTVLSAVAARTETLGLGTAVLLAPIRHPLLLAHQAASLDLLSNGRLTLGLGAGFPLPSTEAQFSALGLDFRTRYKTLLTTVNALRRQWGKTNDGTQPEAVVLPHPVQPDGPPIWLAGSTPRALGDVGRLADGWLPYPPTPDKYRTQLDLVHAAAQLAGRPGSVAPAVTVTLSINEDPTKARDVLSEKVQAYYRQPLERVERVQAMFAGSVDEAATALQSYVDAGAQNLVIRLASTKLISDLELLAAVTSQIQTGLAGASHA